MTTHLVPETPAAPPATSAVVRDLLTTLGARAAESDKVSVVGGDPLVPSVHRLADAMSAAIGVFAQQTAALGTDRGRAPRAVTVDAGAAIDQLMGAFHTTVAGIPVHGLMEDPRLLGDCDFYRTADDRWVFVLTSYPHLRDAAWSVLGDAGPLSDRTAIARAVARWRALDLEGAICARGGVAAMVRAAAEWAEHPAGRHVASRPVVEVERVGDAPPAPLPVLGEDREALDGVRVLDHTHVIAGPVAAQLLARNGADVLHVSRADRPDPNGMLVLTGAGKRNAFCDLRRPDERAAYAEVLDGADVLVNSYRHTEQWGVLAERRGRTDGPGLVELDLHAWGETGPWGDRGGFDQLACAATGFAAEEWTDRPALPPTRLLNDYLAAYLGAAAVASVLRRRAVDGGSWRIRISLAGVCTWVQRLGLLDRDTVLALPRPSAPLGALASYDTTFGRVVEPAAPYTLDGRAVPDPGDRRPLGTSALSWC
ncbi:CoA transferase [Marmoricola endophyticus]|uniref:CoA transferase n=1 Tax=Marmoricola endophyticus TaxID=2040280 RepID=A0A917F853_9ACTN|nr:CoA transferase [Marmoricola endophyticus]GGF52502.1 CoA transferase [Marmoricola endophyticus]